MTIHQGGDGPAPAGPFLLPAVDAPLPLADGITYQCNGQQVSLGPNICSTDVLQTELDAEGNAKEYTVLEGASVLDLG